MGRGSSGAGSSGGANFLGNKRLASGAMIKAYDKPPKGYVRDKGALTAPIGYEIYSNNESYFSGKRKIVLVKI